MMKPAMKRFSLTRRTFTALAAALSIAAISFVSIASAVRAEEPPGDPRIAEIREILEKSEKAGMNATVLIRRNSNVLLHEAYGYGDREAERRMTSATGFDIGSLVKPITAVTLLRLEEEGKLSTGDTLEKYFPETPKDKRGITLDQVLTHTAGFPDIFGGDYQIVSRDWVLSKVLTAPLISPRGEAENYSNAGYSLLAAIIEDITGAAYEDAAYKLAMQPAGVERIGYLRPGWTSNELAVGYSPNGERWGTPLDKEWAEDGPSWNLRGNGGMLGTALEMSQWYEALLDGKILGPAALAKYMAFDGGKAFAHAGGNGIFNTLQVSYVEENTHLTFFTSHAAHPAEEVWGQFRDLLRSIAREPNPGE